MKVIFLDIDGVLQSGRSVLANDMNMLLSNEGSFGEAVKKMDQASILLVKKLCATSPDVKVIMVTTWAANITKEEFAEGLDMPVIGALYPGNYKGGRVGAVNASLLDLTAIYNEDPDFVILDDSSVYNDDDMLSVNHIRVNPYDGITFANIFTAAELLNVEMSNIRIFF